MWFGFYVTCPEIDIAAKFVSRPILDSRFGRASETSIQYTMSMTALYSMVPSSLNMKYGLKCWLFISNK